MSAAAGAAGYLYASGRIRKKTQHEKDKDDHYPEVEKEPVYTTPKVPTKPVAVTIKKRKHLVELEDTLQPK